MSVETIVETALTDDVTGSGIWGERVYPVLTPDDVIFPAVVYQVIDQELIASPNVYDSNVIIDAYDHSYSITREMKEAIIAIAAGAGWTARPGSDEFEKDSGLHHIPIELIITHTI